MFEFLQEKITTLFNKLSKRGLLSENDIDNALKEIRIILLEADVHYRVVKELLNNVKQKVMGIELSRSIDPSKYLLKILKTELITIMSSAASVKINGAGEVIMLIGLQGTGKTTTAVKIARYLKNTKGINPYLASVDFDRPAAQKQLITLAKANGFPVNEDISEKGYKGLKELRLLSARQGCDFIIVDTAGRVHIDTGLMHELKHIKDVLQPSGTILIIDSMMGHDVLKMADGFMKGVGYDGAVFTKSEGDARGGAVISFSKIMNKPILYTGTGESVSAIEPFDPNKLVSKIIGITDMEGFAEKVAEVVEKENVEHAKDIIKGKFTFQDFMKQFKMMKKFGSIESLFSMVPGLKKFKTDIKAEDVKKDIKVYEAIMNSMSDKERNNPGILNGKRKQRIAKGSGTKVEDINKLLKRFYESQRMMNILQKSGMKGIHRYLH